MSDTGAGPVVILGAAAAIPLLAGAGLLYLAYKGVCLATHGTKIACEEVKRRRQETIDRRARDQHLLEKLQQSLATASRPMTTLSQVEEQIQKVHQSQQQESVDHAELIQQWKREQKRLAENRFQTLAKMGGNRDRINMVKENYLKSLADFKPPVPHRTEGPVDAETRRLRIRAETIAEHLKTIEIPSHQMEFFNTSLNQYKFSQAIMEGYRLLDLRGEVRQIEQVLFSVRLDIMTKVSILEERRTQWLDQLVQAEEAMLAQNAENAKNLIHKARAALKEWESRIGDPEAYKKKAGEARQIVDSVEAFCSDSLLPETAAKLGELETITQALAARRHDLVIQKGKTLLKAWEGEEASFIESKATEIGKVVPEQVVDVLSEMGYHAETSADTITGRRGKRVFRVWYDHHSGNLKYDLSHQGFPSQKVCDKELADFLLGLAERGILVDTQPEPTHPKRNHLEDVAEEVLQSLMELDIDPDDIQREEAGETIRFLVKAAWEEMELEVDSEGDTYLDGELLDDTEEIREAVADRRVETEKERE